jgi:hypothetical protein
VVLLADAAVPSTLVLHVQQQGCSSTIHADLGQLLALQV